MAAPTHHMNDEENIDRMIERDGEELAWHIMVDSRIQSK